MFFDSKLHDPAASWRQDPASPLQLARLNELAVPFPTDITKGEAANIISAHREPEIEETEFLTFFGIRDAGRLNQLQAREKIAAIIQDPQSKPKWDQRPATPDQLALIAHMEGSPPGDLTFFDAQVRIETYYTDEDQTQQAEAFEEKRLASRDDEERRSDVIRQTYEDLKIRPSRYGLRRVSFKHVVAAVEHLEDMHGQKAFELEEAFEFPQQVAEQIRNANPKLLTELAVQQPDRFKVRSKAEIDAMYQTSPRTSIWVWIAIAGALVIAYRSTAVQQWLKSFF